MVNQQRRQTDEDDTDTCCNQRSAPPSPGICNIYVLINYRVSHVRKKLFSLVWKVK